MPGLFFLLFIGFVVVAIILAVLGSVGAKKRREQLAA